MRKERKKMSGSSEWESLQRVGTRFARGASKVSDVLEAQRGRETLTVKERGEERKGEGLSGLRICSEAG